MAFLRQRTTSRLSMALKSKIVTLYENNRSVDDIVADVNCSVRVLCNMLVLDFSAVRLVLLSRHHKSRFSSDRIAIVEVEIRNFYAIFGNNLKRSDLFTFDMWIVVYSATN